MKTNKTQDAQTLETGPETAPDLTGKQAKVLAALVAGSTIADAAKANRINPCTVHEWFKRDDFRQTYREALSDVITHSSAQLKAATPTAVSTLLEVAQDVAAPAAPRVSAARSIIELSMKAVELEDLAERIERLEELTK